MKSKEITPSRLLSSWELKEYVDKHSPDSLRHHFDAAFDEIKRLSQQKLGISALVTRGNIQSMLDNLDNDEYIARFKKMYP